MAKSNVAEEMSKRALMDVRHEADRDIVGSLLFAHSWTSAAVDDWKQEVDQEHKEMMDARLMCPDGCMAVWSERKYTMKIARLPMVLLVASSNCFGGFILTEENDVFCDSDNYYTQGLDLLWIGGVRKFKDQMRHTGYGIRNIFYTPDDIGVAESPAENDRPWAGYTSVQRVDWTRKKSHMFRTEWVLGVTGDWSGSGDIQSRVHRMIDSKKPMGWQNQIPSEPFVNVTVDYYKPLWAIYNQPQEWGFDVTGVGGGSIGTAFINGELGLICRAGWNLPEERWSGLIKPTAIKRVSLYALAEQYGRVVGHNVTLGGSIWQDGPERDLEPFVSDTVVGGGLILRKLVGKRDFGVTYRRVWRSDEFKGQSLPSDFGSVSLSLTSSF